MYRAVRELRRQEALVKKFGFDLLQEQMVDEVLSEAGWVCEEAIGDSPIEKLFFSALRLMCRFKITEYSDLYVLKDGIDEDALKETIRERFDVMTALLVRPQADVDGHCVDFLIQAFFGVFGLGGGWRYLIVECDGHDFHEKTKEQARRDKSRDRLAVVNGYDCFRFTGFEIWRNPLGCAKEIHEWAIRGW